jgi:hypothetical protein
MKLLNSLVTAGLIAAAAAPGLLAQQAQQTQQAPQKDTTRKSVVPADARPPKGMCRIWLDNVPAAQQPAATDCNSAIRNRPANGHVIFGDDFADSSKAKANPRTALPPNIKGFTEVKTTLPKRPPE